MHPQFSADVLDTLILVASRRLTDWRTPELKILFAQGLIICNFKDGWFLSEKGKNLLKKVDEYERKTFTSVR